MDCMFPCYAMPHYRGADDGKRSHYLLQFVHVISVHVFVDKDPFLSVPLCVCVRCYVPVPTRLRVRCVESCASCVRVALWPCVSICVCLVLCLSPTH